MGESDRVAKTEPGRIDPPAETGGSATEATARTRDPSPNVPKPEPSYGYTHGEPSGNRVVGSGRGAEYPAVERATGEQAPRYGYDAGQAGEFLEEVGVAANFGVFVPQGWRMDLVEIDDPVEQYEAMTRVAKIADESGAYDSVWLYDHFHTVPEPTQNTVFECWTATAGLSRDTERVKIGQMVTCNGYRNPALLAKMASTVDVMSQGRLLFGLGAGWYEHEWRAYGYGFPETRERMRAFREACEIIHRMWTEDGVRFDGEYYKLDKPINEPKGVRVPHPSFWIGGGGEKVTLRLVARYGDACNVGGDVETVKHKFEVLKGHCDAVGRDYEEITRSTSVNVYLLEEGDDPVSATELARGGMAYDEYSQQFMVGTAEEITARLRAMVEAGVNYFIVYMPRVAYEPLMVERFAKEVIPNFS